MASGLFVLTVVAFLRPPLLPDIGREFDLSALGLGLLGSVFAVGRLMADVPAGRLTDRLSPGPMMATAAGMIGVGSATLALAPSTGVAFAGVMVLGAGSAWSLTTAQAHFALAPRERRGLAMSVFAGALLTAQAVGPGAGGGVGSVAGWRWAIGSGAVAALMVAVGFASIGRSIHRARSAPTPSGSVAATARIPLRVLMVLYLLPAVQFSVGAAVVQTLIPIVADGDLGLGPGTVGAALALGGLGRLVGAVASGRVSDAVGRRAGLIPGLVVQVAGLVVFGLGRGLFWWWIAIVLLSVGSVAVNVGTTVLADLSEAGGLGRRLGAFRFTGDSAFVVAPPLAGWLFDHHGQGWSVVPVLVLTLLVTVGAWAWVPETRHE